MLLIFPSSQKGEVYKSATKIRSFRTGSFAKWKLQLLIHKKC